MATRKRSPLADNPLRLPGEALDSRLQDALLDRILLPMLLAVMLVVLASWEWMHALGLVKPAPELVTAVAIVGVGVAAFRIWRSLPALKALQLARNGERIVGQYLEELRTAGYQAFHDVVGPGFNVDHVIVGPGGVFAVETKTYSKPAGEQAKVIFDGKRLTAGGFEPTRDPIAQAHAQATWLRELAKATTGREVGVFPVLLFPGWYCEQSRESKRDIWVLNPKSLGAFLKHEPVRLTPEDVSMIGYHLSRIVRL